MKTRSYYSFADDPSRLGIDMCSMESDAAPLTVNCAGNFNTAYPFTTHNTGGRLDYYLMHITSGRLRISMPEGNVEAEAGDTVIFPPKHPYKYTYEGGEPLNYMWAHFTGSAAAFYLEELTFSPLPCMVSSFGASRVGAMFETLFDIFSHEDSLRPHALAACLLRILTEIAAAADRNKSKNPLRRSLRYIEASYTEDIRTADLAAMDNLSPSRYYALFKEITGIPPGRYITELRMRHACELLRGTDMSVKQIGVTVGYNDPHFFSKLFKANLGISPTEYRGTTK